MDYNTALQHMISVVNIMAPDGKVQSAFTKMVSDMQKDNINPSDIIVQLNLALADALRYGNWPK